MFNIVLVAPEIPPNTGNVMRLAANTGARLHLVRPLAFSLDDKQLRRAGLDYHEYASVAVHDSFAALLETETPDRPRMFALTTHGARLLGDVAFQPGDWFVFGAETSRRAPWVVSANMRGRSGVSVSSSAAKESCTATLAYS